MRNIAPQIAANLTGASKCLLFRPSTAAAAPADQVPRADAGCKHPAGLGTRGAEPAHGAHRVALAGARLDNFSRAGESCPTVAANPLELACQSERLRFSMRTLSNCALEDFAA
jgi:hypothetical protein